MTTAIKEKKEIDPAIGQRIRAIRKELGLSGGALAEITEIASANLYAMERGTMKVPPAAIKRISTALRVPEYVLTNGKEESSESTPAAPTSIAGITHNALQPPVVPATPVVPLNKQPVKGASTESKQQTSMETLQIVRAIKHFAKSPKATLSIGDNMRITVSPEQLDEVLYVLAKTTKK